MTMLRAAATIAILGGLAWTTELDGFFGSLLQANVGWLAVAALLLPVNIALEVSKWRVLLRTTSDPSFGDALGSILAGYSLGLFTPGRAGDYAGRILYLKSDGIQTAVQTVVDRLISMSVYVGIGLIALFASFNVGIITFSPSWAYVAVIGGLFAILLIALVARPAVFYRLLSRASASDKWTGGIAFMRNLGRRESLRLLLLSTLRYGVFTSQLVVLVVACGGGSSVPLMYVCASLVFLVKTMVPSFTFADLGIRETAAIFFFGLVGVDPLVALNASLMLFALNLVVPAICGAAFLPHLRVPFRLETRQGDRVGSIAR
jgi:uncharacterized membrane protein YbhN (UPF0104 family)